MKNKILSIFSKKNKANFIKKNRQYLYGLLTGLLLFSFVTVYAVNRLNSSEVLVDTTNISGLIETGDEANLQNALDGLYTMANESSNNGEYTKTYLGGATLWSGRDPYNDDHYVPTTSTFNVTSTIENYSDLTEKNIICYITTSNMSPNTDSSGYTIIDSYISTLTYNNTTGIVTVGSTCHFQRNSNPTFNLYCYAIY